jgi:hypothetical protein
MENEIDKALNAIIPEDAYFCPECGLVSKSELDNKERHTCGYFAFKFKAANKKIRAILTNLYNAGIIKGSEISLTVIRDFKGSE